MVARHSGASGSDVEHWFRSQRAGGLQQHLSAKRRSKEPSPAAIAAWSEGTAVVLCDVDIPAVVMMTFRARRRVTGDEIPALEFDKPAPDLSQLPIIDVPFGMRSGSAGDHIANGLKRQANLRWIDLSDSG